MLFFLDDSLVGILVSYLFFLFVSVFSLIFFSWILLFSWSKACFLSFFLIKSFFQKFPPYKISIRRLIDSNSKLICSCSNKTFDAIIWSTSSPVWVCISFSSNLQVCPCSRRCRQDKFANSKWNNLKHEFFCKVLQDIPYSSLWTD